MTGKTIKNTLPKMEKETADAVIYRLDTIIGLLAKQFISGKAQTEAIHVLEELGLQRELIATLTGSSRATVNQRLYEKRKNKGKKIIKGSK